jgi:hypothetical protein
MLREDRLANKVYNEILIVPNRIKGNPETLLLPSQRLKNFSGGDGYKDKTFLMQQGEIRQLSFAVGEESYLYNRVFLKRQKTPQGASYYPGSL